MQDVGLGIAARTSRQAHVGPELALELQQQPLGGFLANAGHLDQPACLLHGHRLRQLGHTHARQHRQRGARPHASDLDQLAKRLALARRGEPIQELGIFPNHEMRQQADRLAALGQVVEGAHRHLHLVADAVAIEQDLGRILVVQGAGEFADHFMPIIEAF